MTRNRSEYRANVALRHGAAVVPVSVPSAAVLWIERNRRQKRAAKRARAIYCAICAILPAALYIAATN